MIAFALVAVAVLALSVAWVIGLCQPIRHGATLAGAIVNWPGALIAAARRRPVLAAGAATCLIGDAT